MFAVLTSPSPDLKQELRENSDKYLSQISPGDELERIATSKQQKMSLQRKTLAFVRLFQRIYTDAIGIIKLLVKIFNF